MSDRASSPPIDPDAPARACQNCAAPLTGPFCAQCGQHDIDYHRSFHHLFHDLMENLFHFEGKFFVTVAWLLAKPGRITLEFIAGRRSSQLNPLRFYIFVSVMFFLGLTLLNHGHLVDIPRKEVDALQIDLTRDAVREKEGTADFSEAEMKELYRRLAEAVAKNGHADRAAIIKAMREARPPKPAVEVTAGPTTEPSAGEKKMHTKVRIDRSRAFGAQLSDKLASGELTPSGIWDALEHRVPSLLFLGVPLFAVLLKLFYLRSGKFYVEHLIFSLHLHTWAFLVFMVGNGYLKLASLGPSWLDTLGAWLLVVWAAWYLFRSFRVVYGQSRPKTAVKIVLLGVVHFFLLFLVAVLLFLGTLAWLSYD